MIRFLKVKQLVDRLDRIGNFLNNKQEKEKIFTHLNEYLNSIQPLFEAASKSVSLSTGDLDKILRLAAETELQSTSKIQDIESQISNMENNPAKYNRIAVVFVGHYRTLKLCMPHYTWFFNQMAKTVDYYFVTWEMNDYAESDIIKNNLMPLTHYETDLRLNIFGSLLKGHRFVKDLQFPNFNFKPYDNNYGLWKILRLTYLAKIAQQLKKDYEAEHNFVYDQVIETRPDLYFESKTGDDRYRLTDCQDNCILTDCSTVCQTENHWDPTVHTIEQFHSGNWYWRMNSDTYDGYSNRYDFFANLLTNYPTEQSHKKTFESFHTCMALYFLANRQFKFANGFDFLKSIPVQSLADLP